MPHASHITRLSVLILALLGVSAAGLWVRFNRTSPRDEALSRLGQRSVPELAVELGELQAREAQMDQTIWAKERLAEKCGQVIEQLWDSLNASSNKMELLASFPINQVTVGAWSMPQPLRHGIELREPTGGNAIWNLKQWQRFVEERRREGWQLAQTEFRQHRFETDSTGQPTRSVFYLSAHLSNTERNLRAILEGDLVVEWGPAPDGNRFLQVGVPPAGTSDSDRGAAPAILAPKGLSSPEEGAAVRWATDDQTRFAIKRIDATSLIIKTRHGGPLFKSVLAEKIWPPEKSFFIDPLILHDLDGDGLSEIILAASNLVLRRRGGRFVSEPLCRHSPELIFTGLVADFDNDGNPDFLCAKFDGLALFQGSSQGTFDKASRLVWTASPKLKYGQILTCGDLDRDGDLDVWLGQYKVPYARGQMPTPYYDANDGHPAYLLLNDGRGNFSDATDTSGLGPKRWRRSYSGSFADLDHDGDLDLVVVSDFAGLDLFANDGRGRFRDVTREWVSESHAFGMAHALADFNTDGRLDLLMIGMNSPTADRLHHLGLARPGDDQAHAMRRAMTAGNRLYLAGTGKPFLQPAALSDSIARSGWSWGCSAFDFDNDGFPDVYIANGHETKQSVRDYETEFWLHDIHVANSREDVVMAAFFGAQFSRTRGRGYSYGGYEKNRFYWNQRGASFVEIGHLMGVALEQDSRNVAADDLDGDGRMDLLVTTFEVWPEPQQTLHIFTNTLEQPGQWIGFRLRDQGRGMSPLSARITLQHSGGSMTRQIVTGDSYRSQHANTVHFGLGQISAVDSVEILWTNGRSVLLRKPAINRYHTVAPTDNAAPPKP